MGSRIEIQSVKKRGYLDDIVQGAITNSSTVIESLRAAKKAVYLPSFKNGRIVVSQSGSGQSGSFQMSGSGNDWTQDNIAGMIMEFIELYQTLDPVAYPDLAMPASSNAIYAAMCADDSLGGITQQQGDWTTLNVPSIGGVPSA